MPTLAHATCMSILIQSVISLTIGTVFPDQKIASSKELEEYIGNITVEEGNVSYDIRMKLS